MDPDGSDPTRSQSESIQTVYSRLKKGDWLYPTTNVRQINGTTGRSLFFLESILNNLTIPAFFFAETDVNIEVVDGQQRLNTIAKFIRGETAISDDESMVYLSPQSVHYAGKKYSNLHPDLKTIFDEYPLTIIYLPKLLEQGAKLEIFRRINEGGTPLTAQDIRLSYYSESPSVTFVRLAGVHADTQSSRNMLAAAKVRGVANPWEPHPKAKLTWHEWWEENAKLAGRHLQKCSSGSSSRGIATSCNP